MKIAIFVWMFTFLLVGCNSHKGEHCVQSHVDCTPCICICSGGVGVPVGGGTAYNACDQWEKDK
jgi:hypothetical protein